MFEADAPENGLATPASQANCATIDQEAEKVTSTFSRGMSPAQPIPDLIEPISGRGIRLFATESRIWRTIAGHEPDYARIPGLDFNCLSIIAACGPPGIPQNDLVRISGQDKRSLPLRTDRLHKSGYIIKRPVTLYHNKALLHTSLLTLQRFAESSEATATELTEAANKAQQATRSKKKRTTTRARASYQGQNSESQEASSLREDGTFQGTPTENLVIRWTPDRNLWNQVFDVVHQSDIAGITLNGLATSLMGAQYKKPIEELLAKLTNSWQLSQPMHLRHLAIVRDSVQSGKTSVYVYYTFEHYQKLVDAGQKTWEAVLMLQDNKQRLNIIDTVHVYAEMDEHGFPNLDISQFQGGHNDGQLTECVPLSRPSHKEVVMGPPRTPRMNGSSGTTTGESLIPVKPKNILTSTRRRNETTAVKKGVGRPRKYPATGIPAGIESWSSDEVKGLIESRRMYDNYQKTKITQEIEHRTQHGEDSVLVAHELLEATDALRKEQGQQPMSNFLIMQILHEYAGGAEPVQEDDTMIQLRNILKESEKNRLPRGKRPRKARPTSHSSIPDNGSSVRPSGGGDSTVLGSVGTRARRPPKAFDESRILHDAIVKTTRVHKPQPKQKPSAPRWHLPSVAEHTQLHHYFALPHDAMRSLDKKSLYWSLPSVAAHSQPHYSVSVNADAVNQTWGTSIKAKQRSRRRRSIDEDAESTLQIPKPKRQKTATSHNGDALPLTVPVAPTSKLPSPIREVSRSSTPAYIPSPLIIHDLMFETYKKAVDSVPRQQEGVYITKSARRYRRRDDPVSMTLRKYQVVIFKSSALHGLAWFAKDQQLASPSVSDAHQGPEQTRNGPKPTLGLLKSPGPDNPPSHAADLLTENQKSLHGKRRTNGLQYEELPDNDERGGNDTVATLVAGRSLPIFEGRRQIRSTKSIVNPGQASPDILGPKISDSHAARARTGSAALVHNSPSALKRPAFLNHKESSCIPTPEAAAELARASPIAPIDDNFGSPPSQSHAGLLAPLPEPRPNAYSSNDTRNTSARAETTQDPSCFIFKSPALNRLDWVRHSPLLLREDEHPLPHDRAAAESLPKANTDDTSAIVSGHSDASYYKAPTQEVQHSAIKQHPRTPRRGRVSGLSGRTGGSTAILRRDIVIHLVTKCGGVFPEAGAMKMPFVHEWKERGQPGVPEKSTIMNAINMCCEQGKLRRIVFSFKDRYGISATSTVLALPYIDPWDGKVKELQEMIKNRHPHIFVPDAVTPKDTATADLTKTKRQQTLLEAAEKQAKINEAKSMVQKSPEERNAYLMALQSSDRSEQEKVALSRLTEPSTRKLQRLGTIKKPAKNMLPWSTAAEVQTDGLSSGRPLSLLSQDRIFGGASTGVGRLFNESSSRTLRPKEARDDEDQLAHQRLRGLARNAAPIERSQRKNIRTFSNTQSSDLYRVSDEPKEYVVPGFMAPVIWKFKGSGTFSTTCSGTQIARMIPDHPATSRKRKHAEDEQQVFPSFMDPINMYHRVTGTYSATFSGFRVGTTKLVRGKRRYNPKARVPLRYQSPVPNLQLDDRAIGDEVPWYPGITSRDTLHPSSGTFSVKFFGFKPRSLQLADRKIHRGGRRQHPRPTKTIADIENFEVTNDLEGLKGRQRKLKRTGLTTEDSLFAEEAEPPLDPSLGPPIKLRRVRGPQSAKTLGKDGALRLSVAVMVVRILTGGIRMTIDWTLVAKAFAPMHDEIFLRSKWSSVLTHMRHNQVKMDADFQTLFTKAYEEGHIPKIDFEHLDDYDWKWLVEWTMAHLDAPADSAPELLLHRASFDQRYTMRDASQQKDLTHFYEFEGFSVKDLRRSVVNRQAYVCHLFPSQSLLHASKMQSEDEQIAIARSWIRASIITPAEKYDPQAARIKLNTFPPPIVEAALKSLLEEKVICERSKGRLVSGRDYEISDYFEKRLRTNISPAQFHCAFMFKVQLDRAMQSEGRARWNYLAQDGDAMAVLNLMANQRVKLVPIDPPLNKWGHTDDGYASRQMDKSKLNFEMDVVPLSSYIEGNPLEPLPPPPALHLGAVDPNLCKIPIWSDIYGAWVPRMWTPVLAAVLGLLAIRSGATAEELQVNVKPSLEVWEVEEILRWMVKAEVAEKVGRNGFRTKEWWWMALGPPPDTGSGE